LLNEPNISSHLNGAPTVFLIGTSVQCTRSIAELIGRPPQTYR